MKEKAFEKLEKAKESEGRFKRITRKYGEFVARFAPAVFIVLIILAAVGIYGSGLLSVEALENEDALPQDMDVIDTFELVESKFGGTDSLRVAIELNEYSQDFEVSDIREPKVLRYADVLAKRLELIKELRSVSTITDDIAIANGGKIPNSLAGVKSLYTGTIENLATSSIGPEFELMVVTMTLTDSYTTAEVYSEVVQAMEEVRREKPPFVDTYPVGEIAINVEMEEIIGPDMGRTSSISMIAIFVIIIILFASLRHTVIALSAVVFGIIWTFGYLGLSGNVLNSMTSGAASMILGIGIDFGIQTVTRFRQELSALGDLKEAMGTTMAGVFIPLLTTTAVAIIGFRAMSMGRLTVMADLGNIMAYGVIFSFLAAVLVVPTLLVLNERLGKTLRRIHSKIKTRKK